MKKPKIPALQRGLRILQVSMLLLGSFLFAHGLYHASEFFGNDFISDDILEPASIVLLLAFSIYVMKFIFIAKSSYKSSPLVSRSSPIVGTHAIAFWFASPLLGSIAMSSALYLGSNMSIDPAEFFSFFGILLATGLFCWMAIKNPSPGSLHFQFAVITIIWAAAEIPHILSSIGVVQFGGFDVYGTWIHFASMSLIGAFVCYRLISLQFGRPIRPTFKKKVQLSPSAVR